MALLFILLTCLSVAANPVDEIPEPAMEVPEATGPWIEMNSTDDEEAIANAAKKAEENEAPAPVDEDVSDKRQSAQKIFFLKKPSIDLQNPLHAISHRPSLARSHVF